MVAVVLFRTASRGLLRMRTPAPVWALARLGSTPVWTLAGLESAHVWPSAGLESVSVCSLAGLACLDFGLGWPVMMRAAAAAMLPASICVGRATSAAGCFVAIDHAAGRVRFGQERVTDCFACIYSARM